MVPIYKDEHREFIEVVVDEAGNGSEVAIQQTELHEWFKRGFVPYCVYYRGSEKRFCMLKNGSS